MPKLWTETMDNHRRAVREAILDTTAALVAERGLRAVTMSKIAENAGIGRATLYKYFPDVDAILRAWHERQISGHLAQLAQLRNQSGSPGQRLETVLRAYAEIARGSRGHDDVELVAWLHRDEHLAHARNHLTTMLKDLLAEAAHAGDIRADIAPDELATFCLHALAAAGTLPSNAAVHRLVAVILSGLRRST
ncbi:TetR/AcrR family transcriptional regulator [Amycolatopsis sp. NPDC051903]|uniref:TetR/AcrR family transcriptional regulator n=1 Tax=Amycolatopsis sp. NPDC051903 TaxID=3363936 RepID=UPI0037A1729F